MGLTWFARLLPYFIVERACIGVNPDHATLVFSKTHRVKVDVYNLDNGTWAVKSRITQLRIDKARAQSVLARIDAELEERDAIAE